MNKIIGVIGSVGFLVVLGAAGASDCGTIPIGQALAHVTVGVAMIAAAVGVYLHKKSRPGCWNTMERRSGR